MKKRVLLFTIMLLFLCYANVVSGLSSYSSKEQLNGKAWKSLDKSIKLAYVKGFVEGIMFCMQAEFSYTDSENIIKKADIETLRALSKFIPQVVQLEEVVKATDDFYADTSNLNIPIADAYSLFIAKFIGHEMNNEEQARVIANLRQRYNK